MWDIRDLPEVNTVSCTVLIHVHWGQFKLRLLQKHFNVNFLTLSMGNKVANGCHLYIADAVLDIDGVNGKI